jgi:hypothetical protein
MKWIMFGEKQLDNYDGLLMADTGLHDQDIEHAVY